MLSIPLAIVMSQKSEREAQTPARPLIESTPRNASISNLFGGAVTPASGLMERTVTRSRPSGENSSLNDSLRSARPSPIVGRVRRLSLGENSQQQLLSNYVEIGARQEIEVLAKENEAMAVRIDYLENEVNTELHVMQC